MKCSLAMIAATLAMVSFSALAEEQLANPFGGQPPDYSPDTGPPGSIKILEEWTGELLGVERKFYLLGYIENRKFHESLWSISGSNGDQYCYVEPRFRVLTETKWQTRPEVGGCWRVGADGTYVDLGGARYGAFDCTRDPKREQGSCVYISASTGKKHKFSIVGGITWTGQCFQVSDC